jgi:hypothetical protein
MDDQEHLDGAAIRARLIELMTRPDFLQAAVDALPPGAHRALLRWWDAAQGFYTALSGLSIAPDPLFCGQGRQGVHNRCVGVGIAQEVDQFHPGRRDRADFGIHVVRPVGLAR